MFRNYVNLEGIKTSLWVSKSGIVILELYKVRGKVHGGVLNPYLARGYLVVRHWGINKMYTVHRLVAACWSNETIDSKIIVRHIDGDRMNNHIDNLSIEDNQGNNITEYQDIFKPYFSWEVK